MHSIAITLERPIDHFVDRKSREQDISPQQAVMELIARGFETLLQEHYRRYRQGEISFGRLAQELGITTQELSHLLEDRGWPAYDLPSAVLLEATGERLAQDRGELAEQKGLLALTAKSDPVLGALWDNEKDAAYDQL